MTNRLAFEAAGRAAREGEGHLIFLHGFGGLASQWQPLQARFADVPSMAFDLPGHGGSLEFEGFGPPKVAARAVITQLPGDATTKHHLVGHSMGGAIACLIALFAPERVASLTLLAPGGFGPEIAVDLLDDWANARTRQEIMTTLAPMYARRPDEKKDFLQAQVAARAQPGAIEALQWIRDGMTKNGQQGVLPLSAIFEKEIPIELVWGTEDRIVPYQQALTVCEAQPAGVTLHTLDGIGHCPAEEAEKQVAAIIRSNFLAA